MAAVTVMRSPAETALGALFDRLKGGLPGDVSVREAALAGFGERGLPHRRVEEFRYFDLRALMRDAPEPAERPGPTDLALAFHQAKAFADVPAARITIVNGYVASALSEAAALPAGIEVVTLADGLADAATSLAGLGAVETARGNPIYQINTAFMSDGLVIRVPAGLQVAQPIAFRFVATGKAAFSTATRILVEIGEGASVTLLETHEGPDGVAYQPNDVLEIVAGDRSTVRHVRLNREGGDVLALSTLTARLGADATFSTLNVVAGAQVSRHQVFLAFAGEGSTAQADGVTLLRGRQHADATLVVDHAVPHCTSREGFKTILDGASTGVFQGKIIVRPRAQKTDGAMKSDTLLLSDDCTMNNKPELEIFADDVVCGHGATCGALDDDLLFYLRSRGLPEREAEGLLLQAFVGPPLETIENEPVREALVGLVETWLASRR